MHSSPTQPPPPRGTRHPRAPAGPLPPARSGGPRPDDPLAWPPSSRARRAAQRRSKAKAARRPRPTRRRHQPPDRCGRGEGGGIGGRRGGGGGAAAAGAGGETRARSLHISHVRNPGETSGTALRAALASTAIGRSHHDGGAFVRCQCWEVRLASRRSERGGTSDDGAAWGGGGGRGVGQGRHLLFARVLLPSVGGRALTTHNWQCFGYWGSSIPGSCCCLI